MSYLFGVLGGLLIAMLFAGVISFGNSSPLDSTDDHVTGARSQMRILVDHGTGCQYLKTASGGLTPRLDAQGKPMCKVEGQV